MFVQSGMIKVTFGTRAAHFGKTIENIDFQGLPSISTGGVTVHVFFYKNNLQRTSRLKNAEKLRTK